MGEDAFEIPFNEADGLLPDATSAAVQERSLTLSDVVAAGRAFGRSLSEGDEAALRLRRRSGGEGSVNLSGEEVFGIVTSCDRDTRRAGDIVPPLLRSQELF